MVKDFNKLQQKNTINDYQERFEEMRSLMLLKNQRLSEDYFISNFISGLREEIKVMLRMLKPRTLLETYEMAFLQEQAFGITQKRFRKVFKQGRYNSLGPKQVLGHNNMGFKTKIEVPRKESYLLSLRK